MLDPDIQTLVRMGDTIGAIGLYQQRYGGSTLVARKAIDGARQLLAEDAAPVTLINDPEIDALIRAGRKIEAIKRYREVHNTGLTEAKVAIDAMAAGRPVPPRPAPPPEPAEPAEPSRQAELQRLIDGGQKIMAIKLYREMYAVGLKEAKDAVEAMEVGQPVQHPAPDSDEPAAKQLQPELNRLIASAQKIAAIKHYREVTQVGLKDAKDAVEAIMASGVAGAPGPTSGPDGLQPELDRLIHAGQKLQAIVHFRQLTHVGLKEAKDAVEARMTELGR